MVDPRCGRHDLYLLTMREERRLLKIIEAGISGASSWVGVLSCCRVNDTHTQIQTPPFICFCEVLLLQQGLEGEKA